MLVKEASQARPFPTGVSVDLQHLLLERYFSLSPYRSPFVVIVKMGDQTLTLTYPQPGMSASGKLAAACNQIVGMVDNWNTKPSYRMTL